MAETGDRRTHGSGTRVTEPSIEERVAKASMLRGGANGGTFNATIDMVTFISAAK